MPQLSTKILSVLYEHKECFKNFHQFQDKIINEWMYSAPAEDENFSLMDKDIVQSDKRLDDVITPSHNYWQVADAFKKNRCLLVDGSAGTGKTWIALSLAEKYANRKNREDKFNRVLYVCFNKLLAEDLARKKRVQFDWILSIFTN